MRPTGVRHHVLQARRRGLWAGLGIALFFLFLMAGREGPKRWGWGGEDPSTLRLLLDVLAGTCAFVTFIVVAARHEVHVGSQRSAFSVGWHFLWWNGYRAIPRTATGAISISHRTWRVRSHTEDQWTIAWVDSETNTFEVLARFSSHEVAQGHALAIARLLDAPLLDSTPDREMAWNRDDVHFHLGDARRLEEDIRIWPLPRTRRLRARVDDGVLRYRIPTPSVVGGGLCAVAGLAGAIAIFRHACATAFDARGLDPNGSLVWWSLLALVVGAVGLMLAWDLALGGHQVLVSAQGAARAPARMPSWVHRMPVATLDHLLLDKDGSGLTLLTSTGHVRIASRLRPVEGRALHDLIRLALTGDLASEPIPGSAGTAP